MIIAVLIVFNTVRIAIFVHREEIGIMRLVGASSAFIRAPFLVEAVLYSFLAVIISAAITFPVIGVIQPKLNVFFETQNVALVDYFAQNSIIILICQFVALAVINMLSASIAMRKYLRT